MRALFANFTTTILVCLPAFAQPAQPPQTFEAADVHVSPQGSTESGGFLPNGRLEFRSTTLLRLLATAYSVPPDRVLGGPSWLDLDRFDVVAKSASPASPAAMRVMLQALLAERFKLSARLGDVAQPVYALTLVKGPQKESSGPGDPECKPAFEEGIRSLTCHHTSLTALAERLPGIGADYFDRPVINRTGLKGLFDFKLQWMIRWQLPQGAEGASLSLFNSVEKQLGVKVVEDSVPMPALTVASATRTPAANPPGVIEKLGSPPTEFEVADIHRSAPDEQPNSNTVMANGRFEVRGLPLKNLIALAYNVDLDRVRGGEKWLESERFDIRAKSIPTASRDALRVMLQSLLSERFHLKMHKEDQPVNVFALTAAKPKLKDADPASRTTCKLSTTGVRTLTCQNTTMAQFAERLRSSAPNYINQPVVDLTGLQGSYDFAISWGNAIALLGTGGRGGATDSAPAGGGIAAPVDRPVGLTIFETVERNLGLKLASQKHPMPVIVIDKIDRTPTEN
jgi:uncharacterized protein (TIGR03435 family)